MSGLLCLAACSDYDRARNAYEGGDYTLDTINQPERRLIESAGGKVVILPGVPGRSTSNVLAKIAKS